ncbi:MAG: CpsB/CapC family capsule biosynthesis tyrosine phosphatase [Planctomycetota bacterium]
MIDIHCHILPFLDDGPDSLETAIKLSQLAVECGVSTIVTTPHYLPEIFTTSPEMINKALSDFKLVLEQEKIPLTILPGQEIHIEADMLDKIINRSLLTLNLKNYFLFEFPLLQVPPGAREMIFHAKLSGLTPVIAHPERNTQIQHNIKMLSEFVNGGALVQITGGSITGHFGKEAHATAEQLLRKELVHVVASDSHREETGFRTLKQAFESISASYGSDYADMLTQKNPETIINGKPLL